MGIEHIKNRKKICALMMAMLLTGWLSGCSGNDVEAMADSVSEDNMSAVAEQMPGSISGNDAAGRDNILENAASGSEAISENSVPDSGTVADDGGIEDMRPAPVKVKGIYVSGPVAGTAKMDDLINLVEQTELNAMVIDVKNDEGKITYKMQSEQVTELEAGVRYIPDIKELVTKCKEKNIYLIARIVAFRDPYLAEKKPEWAVHTKSGQIFRDKKGLAWVNPYEREMWDYLAEIASQAAADGFDEVQFDYIRFSTDIGEGEVDYGPEAEQVDKVEIITEFTEYLYNTLLPQGVYVAADVFGTVIDNETDQEIVGQDYVKMAEHLDYICPMVYPSHYHNGAYGIAVPDADPYATIYAAASSSVQELGAVPREKCAHVRMWLQSFTAGWVSGHISYGPQQIREQIKGAYDAGYEEWILWNAAVNYQPDSLLTEEEAEAERQQWEEEKAAVEQKRKEEEKAAAEQRRKEEENVATEQKRSEEKKVSTDPAEDEPQQIVTELGETEKKLQDQ
ncbi:MAG: sugar fermentation stimulation protein [Lachnospiraceae bacterium]|nr:sugar fermentation stimulation protein [Lachnospiraceae bacterium]